MANQTRQLGELLRARRREGHRSCRSTPPYRPRMDRDAARRARACSASCRTSLRLWRVAGQVDVVPRHGQLRLVVASVRRAGGLDRAAPRRPGRWSITAAARPRRSSRAPASSVLTTLRARERAGRCRRGSCSRSSGATACRAEVVPNIVDLERFPAGRHGAPSRERRTWSSRGIWSRSTTSRRRCARSRSSANTCRRRG